MTLKKARLNKKVNRASTNESGNDLNTDNIDKQIDDLCEFLKGCVMPRDKKDFLVKMKDSVHVRRQCLDNEKKILQLSLHLYVVQPELVIKNTFN